MSDETTGNDSGSHLRLKAGKTVGPGRFTLIKELGRGGMGVVWLAQDTSLGEQIALKFLPPEVCHDPVALNDLRRETVRSHRLTHPNIIRIHDFQQQPDGVAFISMEYVDGQTLSGWRLQQPKQVFAWEQLAPLVKQLCAALDYAHGEGVIHRDLKPANVMLDSRGRVKLADFGIAAVVNDSMSRVSVRSSTGGTLAYMSPQQLRGQRPTVADDVYALGACLYELLASRPPFYTGDITHQVLNEPPTPVGERALDLGVDNPVPPEVAAVIMACLAKDPAQRPASAEAVAAWVGLAVPTVNPVALSEAHAEGQEPGDLPPQPEEEPAPVAAGESWLKRPWVWAVVGVAACLVLGGLGWSMWGKKPGGMDTGGATASAVGSSSGGDNRVPLPSEMQKSLVLHYSFDELRPDKVVPDLSGKNNHARISGRMDLAEGHDGRAFKWDASLGEPQRVVPINSKAFDVPHMAISVWMNSSCTDTNWGRFVDKKFMEGFAFGMGGWWKSSGNQAVGRAIWEIGYNYVESDVVINDGRWHHVVASYDGQSQDLWVDGVRQSKSKAWKGRIGINTEDLCLGGARYLHPSGHTGPARTADDWLGYDGLMDELMIFDRALKQEEVALLFEKRVQKPTPPSDFPTLPKLPVALFAARDGDWRTMNWRSAWKTNPSRPDHRYVGHFRARLEPYFHVQTISEWRLTANDLTGIKVLLASAPGINFTDAECEVIKEYVRTGGGLVCLASDRGLNRLLEPAGIQTQPGLIRRSNGETGASFPVGMLANHPALPVSRAFDLNWNRCLLVNPPAEVIGRVSGVWRDLNDNRLQDAGEIPQEVAVMAVARYGKGRVFCVSSDCVHDDAMVFPSKGGNFDLVVHAARWAAGLLDSETQSAGVTAPQDSQSQPTLGQHWTNSLGMVFVPVPGTEVKFSIWETRVQDFGRFVMETGHDMGDVMVVFKNAKSERLTGYNWKDPGFRQGPEHPVVGANWDDAKAFCAWLTEKERREGNLGADQVYRLPTDLEWNAAVGLGVEPGKTPRDRSGTTKGQHWGEQWPPPAGSGNFAGEETRDADWPSGFRVIAGYKDGYARTAPVGSFAPNRFGLFDLEGNVIEWVADLHTGDGSKRTARWGSWFSGSPEWCSPSFRTDAEPGFRASGVGFRIVRAKAAGEAGSRIAAATKNQWTNTLGMVFVPVPGTEVKFSIWETRVQDFAAFVDASGHDMGNKLVMGRGDGWKNRTGYNWRNPGFPQGPTHPVVGANWNDAQAFCRWLTDKEQAAGAIAKGQRYRLPTDAEWSAAVGPAKFPWGDSWPPPPRSGNYGGTETIGADWPWGRMTNYTDDHVFAAPVGSYPPNALGLYDLGGNLWEWCEDYYRAEMNPEELRAVFKSMNNDGGGQRRRVFRGASWVDPFLEMLASANRLGTGGTEPEARCDTVGFRVVLDRPPRSAAQATTPAAPAVSEQPVEKWRKALASAEQGLNSINDRESLALVREIASSLNQAGGASPQSLAGYAKKLQDAMHDLIRRGALENAYWLHWALSVALYQDVDPATDGPEVNAARRSPGKASADGLVLHLPFDEPATNGTVRDTSGAGNHGRVIGAKWVTKGWLGGAYRFCITNLTDCIVVPDSDTLDVENVTVAAWIKTDDNGGFYSRILDKDWRKGFTLCMGGSVEGQADFRGKVLFRVNKTVTGTDGRVADGAWHHVAGTYDGTVRRLYVDGVLQAWQNRSKPGPISKNNWDFAIGNSVVDDGTGEFRAFDGLIDDVRVYNRALSANEIKALASP